ncbi:MAG TPA: molybdenum cofactor guanylyltransferase [Anaerolineaceae bacterium]
MPGGFFAGHCLFLWLDMNATFRKQDKDDEAVAVRHSPDIKLSVVVQAGGESRRMGQEKALVSFLGQPLIQRVVNRVKPVADELFVTSNQPESFSFLRVPVYRDLLPGKGVLSGFYTALSLARHPLVAIIACDMAFVSSTLLVAERNTLLAEAVDGVVPQTRDGYEPFHAVYRREPCLAAVKSSLEAGLLRADSWYRMVRIRYFQPEEILAFDPRGEAFININTPEDLARAENYALRQ